MLNEIIERTKERVELEKSIISLDDLKKEILYLDTDKESNFEKLLESGNLSFIGEIKKVSLGGDGLSDDFDYLQIAKNYQNADFDAVSVCTEPYFFKGNYDYLKEISDEVSIPVLADDFIIDEYMIYQFKVLGASAVLLKVKIIDVVQLKKFIDLAHSLGLSAIVEVSDSSEVMKALSVGAEIICVENSQDIENTIDLRRCVGEDIKFISRGSIKSNEDIIKLKENNVHAIITDEYLI